MKLATVALVLAGTMGAVYLARTTSDPPAAVVAKPSPEPVDILARAQAVESEWIAFKGGKTQMPPLPSRFDEADRELTAIPADWEKANDAIALVKRLRAERASVEKAYEVAIERQRKADEIAREARRLEARKAYPKTAEKLFLDAGQDYYFTVSGKDLRTLKVKYVLMSRPMVHQISQKSDVVARWREMGFHKVELTDGFRETWTLTLN